MAFSLVSWVVLFGLVPLAIGRRGRRVGWREGRPRLVHHAGLAAVGLGSVGLAWCAVEHYPRGGSVALSLVPEKLIGSGPYRFSRNPMYVSELTVLLGWTLYFGSPSLLGCSAAQGTAMRYAVGREERTLRAQFGDRWLGYAARVPRWV